MRLAGKVAFLWRKDPLMSHQAVFLQECPTCSRSLEIRVDHLGRRVYCCHCGAGFLARSREEPVEPDQDADAVLRRAEWLIAEAQSGTPRWTAPKTW
jgi:hypothetical protein